MQVLNTWLAALTGLLIIILGGLTPAATITPNIHVTGEVLNLSSTWQVSALLISSIVFGHRVGVIASTAYLTIGVFYLPIFHGGGSLGYLMIPDFGYLAGFIPAAYIVGILGRLKENQSFMQFTKISLIGLFVIHFFGISNIILGSILSLWSSNTLDLIISYSIKPIPIQILLCTSVGIISKSIRSLLLL